ncbi:hypothetical protein KXR53_15300 [Inquilinus limosus]|uniref:hypothetical protein n=1 Tax=Inquilinus limosus TaxID=171674 RepID=UPI003F179F48
MPADGTDLIRGLPDASPRQGGFICGAWPVGRAALAALIDMGMTEENIARYFSISPDSVAAIRAEYQATSGSELA